MVCLLCDIDIALSPGHSHIFNVTALKTWEWPVDKATIDRHYDDVDKDWSSIEHMPYAASVSSIDHVI